MNVLGCGTSMSTPGETFYAVRVRPGDNKYLQAKPYVSWDYNEFLGRGWDSIPMLMSYERAFSLQHDLKEDGHESDVLRFDPVVAEPATPPHYYVKK